MGVYENLGVRTIINASGTLTRVGGSRMAPEVLAAMAEAAASFVHIDELQARAGEVLARATGAEAGYVTSGASAGLTLGVAACVAGMDVGKMDRLPDVTGMKSEVVVQRGHRNSYDHAIRAVGVTLVEVGYLGYPGAGGTMPWQLEEAITDRTAAVCLPDLRHAGHAEPARGRRDRACPWRPGDRRRRSGAPPAGQPAPVHRRGSRPRRLLRRQGDRRPAVQRHPRRPRRPDRLGRPAASGHGRARADVEPAVADRLRRDRGSSPSGPRPLAQGRTRGDRRAGHGARALSRPAPTTTTRGCGPSGWTSSPPRWARSTASSSRADALPTGPFPCWC